MATVCKFQRNGSDVVDCNTSTLMVSEYVPARPNISGGGRYDLVTRIKDEFSLVAKAATLDAVANALGTLERYLYEASLDPAKYLEFNWQPDTLTNAGKANVYDGVLKREGRAEKANDGYYVQRAIVEFVRDPVWYGTFTSITFDASTPGTTDNDDTCYVVLPTIPGDLPAFCRFMIASSGGNTASAQRALLALKANGTPANFSHILQVESATYLEATLTNQASTNYSPGTAGTTAKRYAAADTDFKQIARWDITSNLDAWVGSYLALLRLRENTADPNYQWRMRAGDIVGSSYIPGPWGTASKIKTPVSNSGATTEWLLLPMGTLRAPRQMGRNTPKGGIYFDLWGEALSVAGSNDLDNLFLFPVGECGPGLGLIAAEFDVAFDVGRAAFDSRPGMGLAYLHDGTDYLAAAAGHPQGGALYLMPQRSLQRVYALVTRNEAGYFKHDRTNTLSITGYYQPRWINMPGTN